MGATIPKSKIHEFKNRRVHLSGFGADKVFTIDEIDESGHRLLVRPRRGPRFHIDASRAQYVAKDDPNTVYERATCACYRNCSH